MTVIVPDLLGHGLSAKPRTDYSRGVHANMLRDLLDGLGHDRVTLVGHSLDGVALRFAYQYRRCEALMLVASGGLGCDVAGLLRAAALPGSELALRLLTGQRHVRRTIGALARPLPTLGDVDDVLRIYGSLATAEARSPFLATLRAVIDPAGQRVSAMNRPPTATQIPTLFLCGSRDPIIPVRHAATRTNSCQAAGGPFSPRPDTSHIATTRPASSSYSWTSSTALTAQQSGRPVRWPRRPRP